MYSKKYILLFMISYIKKKKLYMVFLAGSNPARATINFNFLYMVNEFYQGLPSNYANYEDIVLPKHESMREKTRREGVYGYYDHWNKDASTWIDRFCWEEV